MKRALLINKGSADNLGDQSIRYVLEKLLINNGYNVDFEDITGEEEREYIDYKKDAISEIKKDNTKAPTRIIYRKLMKTSVFKNLYWFFNNNIEKRINKISINYDIIIIGGGQLILSNSTFPIAIHSWIKYLESANMFSKKVIFGVGASERFNWLEKKYYKNSFKKLDEIYVRDYNSIKSLEKEFKQKTKYVPDVAFYLSRIYKPSLNKEKKVLIGVTDYEVYKRYNKNCKSFLDEEKYYTWWESKIIKYKNKGYKIELFYTTIRDLAETLKFQDFLRDKDNLSIDIKYVNNLEQLVNEISKSSIIISGRMHALILGLSYNCEVIPFIISNKIKTFETEYINERFNLEETQKKIENTIQKLIN